MVYGNRVAFSSKNILDSYHGELQIHSIGDVILNTSYITLRDDISGNDASFNNVKLSGDISGNDVSFNSMDLLGNIKIKGDISGNDVSFNNMDINSIESNNWYIKVSGDIRTNDVSFNNIFLAGSLYSRVGDNSFNNVDFDENIMVKKDKLTH